MRGLLIPVEGDPEVVDSTRTALFTDLADHSPVRMAGLDLCLSYDQSTAEPVNDRCTAIAEGPLMCGPVFVTRDDDADLTSRDALLVVLQLVLTEYGFDTPQLTQGETA